MKKNFFYLVIVFVSLLLLTKCSEKKNDSESSGFVKFSFNAKSNLKSAGGVESEPGPSSIYMTIKDSHGGYVYNLHKFPLIKIGDEYMTEQIELTPDNYTIEDFIVVDGNDSAIYLTPKAGSEFENLVDHPLPVNFEVTISNTSSLVLEVIPANLGEPLDYGYATFSFTVVNTLESGLMAYYPFNGNATDATGNGNDGVVNGATLTTDRSGVLNSAYCFGGDDYIQIPTASFFNNMNTFSICVWVYPTQISPLHNSIISKVNPNRDFNIKIRGDKNKYEVHFAHGNRYYGLQNDDDPVLNTWTYIVCEWTGDNWKMFINGRFAKESEPIDEKPIWTGTYMTIGNLDITEFFKGKIDEVRIYNRLLTNKEIYTLYTLN